MQKWPAARIFGQVVEDLAGQNSTRGGSRERDTTDWHVIPAGPSVPVAVTTTTPVEKWPRTSRKCRRSASPTAAVGSDDAPVMWTPPSSGRW